MPEDGCCPERDNSCMFRCRIAIVIGKRLKISRVRADLTQAELGALAGLDEESASARISSYEKDVMHPISNSSVSWQQRLMYRKRIFMLLTMSLQN